MCVCDRCVKKDTELASAQARLREAEALLNSREAALNTAVLERKALESTVTDLQLHVQEVQLDLHHHQSHFMQTPQFTGSVCVPDSRVNLLSHTELWLIS